MSSKVSNKKQKITPGGEADRLIKICSGLLKHLTNSPTVYAFLVPVDWKGLKIPQYPKMIKHPMDLGTVEGKLHGGRYANVSDFTAAVNLVWDNAQLLNQEGSYVFDIASQLRKLGAGKRV